MKILQTPSDPELSEGFWLEFQSAISHLENEKKIMIGLAGGSSFDLFYATLSERFHELHSDIRKKIHFAFLDERIVEIDHEERNEKQLRDKFLNELLEKKLLDETQILSVDITKGDIASDYGKRVPKIHIGFFGVGPDGHIASLFPHHLLLLSEGNGYLEIFDSPKPPPHRITVSPKMTYEIEYCFVAFMKGKEEVLAHFLDQNIGAKDCPAKILLEGESLVVLSNIRQ